MAHSVIFSREWNLNSRGDRMPLSRRPGTEMRFRATEEKVPKLAKACARRLLPCQSANRLASLANRWSRIALLSVGPGRWSGQSGRNFPWPRHFCNLRRQFLGSSKSAHCRRSCLLAMTSNRFGKSPGYLCQASIDCDIILGRVNLVVRKAECRT